MESRVWHVCSLQEIMMIIMMTTITVVVMREKREKNATGSEITM